MKTIFPILLFGISFLRLSGQSITNVGAEQDRNNAIITYDLKCEGEAEISLYYSEDNGVSFKGPLKSVSGGVGYYIVSGNHSITWETLNDQKMLIGTNIIFQVRGSVSKKSKIVDKRDNTVYKTILIGNHVWMAENMKYNSGKNWCYKDDISNCTQWGRLYDWETAKNICFPGWHLPSKNEFETLLQNVGTSKDEIYNALTRDGKSGFDALLVGTKSEMNFAYMGRGTHYWSSSEDNKGFSAWSLYLYGFSKVVKITSDLSKFGYSVRCIKDGSIPNGTMEYYSNSSSSQFSIISDYVPIIEIPPYVYIKKYVEVRIDKWQQKSEFEKTTDYQKRVNDQARNLKIQELTNEAVKTYKNEFIKTIDRNDLQLNQYDADNETYLIKSTQLGEFALPVSIGEAQSFKQEWNSMKIFNIDFSIKENRLVLAKLTISNPNNGKKFIYDSKLPTTYTASNITYNFAPIEIAVPNDNSPSSGTKFESTKLVVGKSDVDVKIPKSTSPKPSTYALIVGNEDYTSYQTGLSNEVNVEFAKNDARVFAEYCKNTLGIPDKQIKLLINATGSQMRQGLAWINNLAGIENGNAELIFYYSGHGLPDEVTKEPYLIPVDVSGTQIQYAVKLEEAYVALTAKPSKQVTVFLDACFSGGARNQSLIAMKSVKIKPNNVVDLNNIVVFASSSGDESSAVYKEKQHGYFTYFLLKKLQDSKGDVDYGTLSNYLMQNVSKETGLISKKQTPQVLVDPQMQDKWVNLKLK